MSRTALALALAAWSILLSGCPRANEMEPFRQPDEPDYGRPLPPGQMALRKIPPEQYPDFGPGYLNRTGLEEAIRNSLAYLAKPSSHRYFPYLDISHARAVRSLEHFLAVLASVRSPQELNAVIRRDFEVYQSVGWNGRGGVFFTGYYTPIFDGRRQRDGEFRYPLYRQPPDLMKDPDGITLGRRTPEGRVVPYYTRREIEEGGVLDGQEIAWLRDPFEAYVVTVQGSAKLRQADGSMLELAYAANNGKDYKSIGQEMIRAGKIARDQLSLQNLIRYFKEHPDDVARYTRMNDRTVFFQELPGGPFGSLNVPVLPYRSIATDKSVFPRACLAFSRTRMPVVRDDGSVTVSPYSAFALDQDTGGAIRAAGRADIYMGIGPSAEAIAGRVGSEGQLYYVFVKEDGAGTASGN